MPFVTSSEPTLITKIAVSWQGVQEKQRPRPLEWMLMPSKWRAIQVFGVNRCLLSLHSPLEEV